MLGTVCVCPYIVFIAVIQLDVLDCLIIGRLKALAKRGGSHRRDYMAGARIVLIVQTAVI